MHFRPWRQNGSKCESYTYSFTTVILYAQLTSQRPNYKSRLEIEIGLLREYMYFLSYIL